MGTEGLTTVFFVCLFVFLYLYPVAWGPKGHGSGGFFTCKPPSWPQTSLRGHSGVLLFLYPTSPEK